MSLQPPSQSGRARAGLSIVEVLVALVIVQIGLLGIAGTAALALRTTLASARQHRAEQQAVSRLAQLAAGGCALARTGTAADSIRHIREAWAVGSQAGGYVLVTDSVAWLDERGARSLSLATAIKC